jgi:hypothetical protein
LAPFIDNHQCVKGKTVMFHALHRLYTRNHDGSPSKISFNEATGEVCTSSCRREARLDDYHYVAQYNTLINR